MNCPRHPNEKMILLLNSWVCDVCDGKKPDPGIGGVIRSGSLVNPTRAVQVGPTGPANPYGTVPPWLSFLFAQLHSKRFIYQNLAFQPPQLRLEDPVLGSGLRAPSRLHVLQTADLWLRDNGPCLPGQFYFVEVVKNRWGTSGAKLMLPGSSDSVLISNDMTRAARSGPWGEIALVP